MVFIPNRAGVSNAAQCIRLSKTCQYPDPPTTGPTGHPELDDRLRQMEQQLNETRASLSQTQAAITPATSLLSSSIQGPSQSFPQSFFLDVDLFTPLKMSHLAYSEQPSIQQIATSHIGTDHMALCESYFSTTQGTHGWLPMLSRKRLMNELRNNSTEVDSCQALLLLCMKLCSGSDDQPRESTCTSSNSCYGLRALHAIYPAAYLTIARAARLGALMGLYDRNNPQQLFERPETWTLREEQRRTWWAIFILDRFLSIETSGLPLSAPEPCPDELLPVNDEDWDEGKIVPSEPLYTQSFSYVTTVGMFARTCQAAHILGKVIRHKEARKLSQDVSSTLREAKSLHCALESLYVGIQESGLDGSSWQGIENSRFAGLALCFSARFLLYNQYGCNEIKGIVEREPIALETEMQSISLEGITFLTYFVARLAHMYRFQCPLFAQCYYYAATECAWFIKEDHEPAMLESLRYLVDDLERLGEQWAVGAEYIALLEQGGVLKLLDTGMDASNTA
ncbi:Fc.00g074130.m01.CDS01 [Cosmosporella sp. VM-42]